ncbi:Mysoin-binding motif of peroxisomes-domain-containing protein [Annulohypoxylon maeteangense]|uniref:Mysoin-binding motif of peroxisomes-domain-containing protein n=1 Tax=Annulohypoxylon maeteangense TaxID=1927788 RepID=UPI00200898A0|nr:Mysoin-binding motif of peroxisomes-domain-containing protein [Annulohypoxylon maeteangense]KAI0890491.1 Mysoin-binding motif of peroxisomes-domain-containing protein [Annulohypoxylon maeteangense]
METHVDEGTPLSNYLEGTGERDESLWQELENDTDHDFSPESSPPRDFAPRGLAKVRKKFRENLPRPLCIDSNTFPSRISLDEIHNHASPLFDVLRLFVEAVTSSIDHAKSIGFLERLRLAIIQSQLLDNPLVLGYQPSIGSDPSQPENEPNFHGLTASGAVAAAVFGFGAASLARWFVLGGFMPTWKRLLVSTVVTSLALLVARTYVRRQLLRNIQKQGLVEASAFFSLSREYDCANSAALNFVMEVELVARGYRLSTPIPPISRLENNGQNVKCLQLRNALRNSLTEVISKYYTIAFTIWGFAEQTELMQLQSQYQFTVTDVVERFQVFSRADPQNAEKLQPLKDAAFLFHDIRKMFLSGLLALHSAGNDTDRLRFSTILEAFKELNVATKQAYVRVRDILADNDFQIPKTPRSPETPGHDRWRHQVRRLNSMTMNIRSVQAKLHLLREESSKALNEADDISDLGPLFMAQYDSIGQDLRDLMEAWQTGKASLASGIDRNEKRLSSIGSTLVSPLSTMSGRTIVEEDESSLDEHDGVADALKKLTGDTSPPVEIEPEVFEAISIPRPKSLLTREERIIRMREDRKSREVAKAKAEAQRGMMRELQGVLDRKPGRGRVSL